MSSTPGEFPTEVAFSAVAQAVADVAVQWHTTGVYTDLEDAATAAYDAFCRRLAADGPEIRHRVSVAAYLIAAGQLAADAVDREAGR